MNDIPKCPARRQLTLKLAVRRSRKIKPGFAAVASFAASPSRRRSGQRCETFRMQRAIAAMRQFNDLTGKKFGDLRVIGYAGTDRHHRRRWRVYCEHCEYGVKIVLAANPLSGRTKTCGCIARYKAHLRMKSFNVAEEFAALEAKGMTFEQAKAELGF